MKDLCSINSCPFTGSRSTPSHITSEHTSTLARVGQLVGLSLRSAVQGLHCVRSERGIQNRFQMTSQANSARNMPSAQENPEIIDNYLGHIDNKCFLPSRTHQP